MRPCHPLLCLSSSGDQHSRRWQWWWLPGRQCPGGTASPASASQQQVSSLWGRTVAPWWGESLVGVCKATVSAVGRFSVAPWLLHTHEVPVWHVEEQQLGPACGRLWQPCWGGQPHAPLSQKHPLRCREASPSQGFEPSSATPHRGGNGSDNSGRAGAASRSRSRGRSSAGHRHRSRTLLWTVPLQLLHVLPWQSSWDEKQPLCLCAGVQGTEQCEIVQPSLGAAAGC